MARPASASATHLPASCSTAQWAPRSCTPYKGTGPGMQDLIGGRIDFLCDIIATAAQIDGGKVRASRS